MAMEKTFDASEAEARIYAMWEENGCFAAGANKKRDESFTIVIPPPNVTGSLHMGHALNNTLQDILVRWHRMRGFDTLWQPGTDHAGIATQMVVERQLEGEGKKRTDFSRDDFIAKIWKWKEQSGGTIANQLKRLGASCDWSRERFTMDEGLSAAVRKTFVDLYNKGLIYKGKRLVNWDPKFETAISDLEVENIETSGHMWHFKYPLAGGETYEYVEKDEDGTVTLRETRDYISIATTRPETMLGDGAVAVHPDDERYAPIVGKLCEIPVGPKAHRRLIPIITDEYPDPDFGSGAVKITGAHDFNDYQVAKRNGIPMYNLMDTRAAMRSDGKPYTEEAAIAQTMVYDGQTVDQNVVAAMNLVPDEYRGLDRLVARERVVADITAEGLAVMTANPAERPNAEENPEGHAAWVAEIPLVESKSIMQPFGDRSKVVIEPLLTDQWFVDAEALAKPALEAVRDGTTSFVPKNWEKTYFNWLDNIEPWCISRQLWWGHQVPVWYGPVVTSDKQAYALDNNTNSFVKEFCAETEDEALALANAYYGPEAEAYISKVDELHHEMEARGDRISPTDPALQMTMHEVGTKRRYAIHQDPDVLDTWFSSALWPFSTLGWPEDTPELATYYKTDVLITGFDIIFFWVARMMMMGLEFKDEVPFHTVYINSIIVDEYGKKMSKSVGNVIDPLDLIQGIDIDTLVEKRTTGLAKPETAPKIAKQTRGSFPNGFPAFGADALRFTLAMQEVQGRMQSRLSVDQVEGGRNFGTKLWNAARFAEFNECKRDPAFDPANATQTVNKWIIGETAKTLEAVNAALDIYRFNDAASTLYAHVYFLCDWYVEFSKPLLSGADGPEKDETKATVVWAIDQCLLMLHPIMPFITEELWRETGGTGILMLHDWPTYAYADLKDEEAEAEMRWTISLIETIRSTRSEMNVPASAKIELLLTDFTPEAAQRLLRQNALVSRLARLSEAAVGNEAPAGSIVAAVEGATVNLPLADIIDVAAETARLEKSLGKLDKEIKQISAKLGNEKFMAKAPEDVVAEQRERLASAEADREKLSKALDGLKAMG